MNFTNIFKDNSAYILYKIIKNKSIFYYAPIISVQFCKEKILGNTAFEIIYEGIMPFNKIKKIEEEKWLDGWRYKRINDVDVTIFTFIVPESICPFIDYYRNSTATPISIDIINTLNYFVCVASNEKGEGNLYCPPLRCFY